MDDSANAPAGDTWDDPQAACGHVLRGGHPLHLITLSPAVLNSTLEMISAGQAPYVVVIADVGTALHHYLAHS
jgi:hypothetical protein